MAELPSPASADYRRPHTEQAAGSGKRPFPHLDSSAYLRLLFRDRKGTGNNADDDGHEDGEQVGGHRRYKVAAPLSSPDVRELFTPRGVQRKCWPADASLSLTSLPGNENGFVAA